jgi:hypothetical protein
MRIGRRLKEAMPSSSFNQQSEIRIRIPEWLPRPGFTKTRRQVGQEAAGTVSRGRGSAVPEWEA